MNTRPAVALLGAFDTKADEYRFVREQLRAEGCEALLIDTGVLDEPRLRADITRENVAAAAGADLASLREGQERGASMVAMGSGAAAVLENLVRDGGVTAAMALGGSNAAYVFSKACAGLPIGFPKVLVSTMAAGDTRPYVGHTDLTLVNPVVDINGLNRISKPVLANAAKACAGMARSRFVPERGESPVVAISMFGVTTQCGSRLAGSLTRDDVESLTFHCTGVGGQSMEALIRAGQIEGVADMTTTELADELVGGVCSAGPDRLTAAARAGIPQVVSLGALDMVNFGPRSSVPAQFSGRTFYEHNPEVTLMRTSAEECAELGRRMSAKLNASTGRVAVIVPTAGLSMISVPGGPFHDPAADGALIESLTSGLRDDIAVHTFETHINDPKVADFAARILSEWIKEGTS